MHCSRSARTRPPIRGGAAWGLAAKASKPRNTAPKSPSRKVAVKWNSPLYGIEGQGWFLGIHCFTHYIKVAFFRGTSLRPVPPGDSKSKERRSLDIHEDDRLDEAQLAA